MNAFKAVNPLLTFRPLSTNVEHVVSKIAQIEQGFCDASCPQTGAQNILIVRKVVGSKEAVNVGIVAKFRQ